ncbi:MAG: AMP-binding protein [Anaerolineales bacterium]|nr:AMP-binding protein [Anaerolineales bacterium]
MSEPIPPEVRARFPLITPEGAALLRRLEEHPHAPRYTHPGVDRLTPAGLRRAAEFEAQLGAGAEPGPPAWLADYVAACYRRVPAYRRRGPAPADFAAVPLTTRADLARAPWDFVPDDEPLDGLVVYNTSGTTGHPLAIPTHADTLTHYLPLLRAALRRHGLDLPSGPGRVAVLLVAWQRRTYTYAAVSALLGQAGFVKINLDPAEWRDPADRARFLDDCAPAVITGDPLAFAELAALPLTHRPAALVSTALALAPALARSLEARFGCPVLDVYSLNETGPLAVQQAGVYHLLQPRLHVEILDEAGRPCPPGGRGEVVVSGGFNPYLPLLRYRTNDFAAGEVRAGRLVLTALEGRPPVIFRGRAGRRVNSADVSLALRDLPLSQFALHQHADGALTLRMTPAPVAPAVVRERLLALFGAAAAITVEAVDALAAPAGKLRQFTTDLAAD